MPITPKGTLTLVSFMPLGRTVSFSILPDGEGNVATCRMPPVIARIRSAVSFKRSYLGFKGSIAAKSLAFSSRIRSVAASTLSANAYKVSLMISSLQKARDPLPAAPV